MIYIDDVKKDNRYPYDVITYVCITTVPNVKGTKWVTKQDMIRYMKSNPYMPIKTKYLRYNLWYIGEDVRVVDDSYLRTDGNNIKADNLGEL